MSSYIEPAPNLSEAWLRTLEHVVASGGHAVNVITTVENPLAAECGQVRAAIDEVLTVGHRGDVRLQSVETVAGTIFPRDLYADTGLIYRVDLDAEERAKLDASAAGLYDAYVDVLPLLTTDQANNRGTYFGRMVSWPGKAGGGRNQLADRVTRLRRSLDTGKAQRNLEDVAVGGEAELIDDCPGLQIYAASDRRERGFPCLVHVDLTLYQGRLSMAATYRHQYLMTKAYGNLLGLSRLLGFLAQQTGFGVGELMVNATFADAEQGTYTKRGVTALLADARAGA
ncbi:hypothetical protein DQ239_08720 [Blastococcus sp. TF02-09]|uniref:hypothetical protein n=1 Tax=Blastococcus sp. TF02-09 TaxID=2250576 RepID=UPI000DE96EAA|nr:hypothetical protein [Blastococcus sp. TF02-9]RBY78610.1 hypothetical protein DQ239_08720 [Blastococcus sp. TF02-9]